MGHASPGATRFVALRPIVPIAAGMVAGILALGDAQLGEIAVAALALAGTAACAVGGLARTGALALVATSAALGAELLAEVRLAARPAGALAAALRDAPDTSTSERLAVLEGVVVGCPLRETPPLGDSRFRLRVANVDGRPARGCAAVSVAGAIPPALGGARVRVVGRLRAPPPPRGLGERDPRVAALDRDVAAYVATRAGGIAVLARSGPPPHTLLRERALDALRSRLDGESLGIAAALAVGVYDFTSRDLLEAHAHTGALPHLAISGMHVVLVSAALRPLLARLLSRRRAAIVLACALAGYAAFAGFAAPVVRGAAAAALVALAPLAERRAEGLGVLSAAAVLEALVDPAQIPTPSFQLSYAAVGGLLVAVRPLDAWLPGPRRGIGTTLRLSFAMSIAAFLATAGIAASAFGCVSPAALLVSLPLALLVPPMLAASMAACLPGALGDVAASSFTILEAAERAVVLAADRLPATPLSLPGVPPLVIGAIGVAALLAIARRWRAAGLAAALAGAGLALRPTPPVGSLVVVLHSVGHGLAATVVLPDGTAVQVDAGSLDRQDAAARVLAPAFRTLGLSRLEVVSVSHADADHANAMEALLAFAPARGWIADPKGPWAPMLARSTACPRPAAMALDAGGATLRWSAPRSPPHARENDRSIVAVATFGGRTIVIPGDLEEAGARAWLDGEPRGRADVLVLPHHGLDNGQVALLADRLRPAIVLASSGGRFSTGRAEAALASRGLGLYTTHRFGSLAVVVDGDGRVTLRSVAGRRSLDED